MVEDAIRKADVLIEALGYIRQFRHRMVVIKIGGSVMENSRTLDAMLQDIVFMETVGLRPVLVHGGGRAISRAMRNEGIEPRFVQGRRYTDERTLQIVVEVLVQQINAKLLGRIEHFGGRARGLHFQSTNCLFGERIQLQDKGRFIQVRF